MKAVSSLVFHLCRLCLAAVFLYAGAVKSADIGAFAGQIAAYRILPAAANSLVAATLPYIEVLAGLLLLLNRRIRPALLVLGGLLLAFMAALGSLLVRGLEIDCGCFALAQAAAVSATEALVRDAALLILVVLVWWLRGRLRQSSDRAQED